MEIHDLGAARADDNPDFSQLRLPSFSKEKFVSGFCTYGKMEKGAAKVVFENIVGSMSDLLLSSGHLSIFGFGSFELKQAQERIGRNPRTAENLQIEPRIRLKFSPGVSLRKAISGALEDADLELDRHFRKFGFRIELYESNGAGGNALLQRVALEGKAKESDLLELLAYRGLYSRRNAARAVDLFKAMIFSELAAGISVRLSEFGTFSTVERRVRLRRNPFTGESMHIGPGRRIKFKISGNLRQDIQAWEPE